MASVMTSGVPGALENASLASDSYGGNQQATTAGAIQNGETVPADGAVADVARAPDASATPRRSIASLGFPSAPPDYDARPKRGYLAGAPARPPAPPDNTAASTTTGITANTTTASPSGVRTLRSALRPAGPNPARRSSERAPVRGRREAESYDALAMENQLQAEITAVEEQVSRVVRELEHVQRAIRSDEPYYGKDAVKLAAEEKWLVRKEQLLREKEGHLREERLELIRSRSDQRRRASEVARQRSVAFGLTPTLAENPGRQQAQQRVPETEGLIQRRRSVSGAGGASEGVSNSSGSERAMHEDFSGVIEMPTPVEGSRLQTRMETFNLPVLVGTLLSGFTLVLFDVATTDLSRRLAVVAFALEISSSTVLCCIMFHGQQLYTRSSDMKLLTKTFLDKTCTATIASLAMLSLGVAAFVASFLVEAGDHMGDLWLAIFAAILSPTVLAASMFPTSAAVLRRLTMTVSQWTPPNSE